MQKEAKIREKVLIVEKLFADKSAGKDKDSMFPKLHSMTTLALEIERDILRWVLEVETSSDGCEEQICGICSYPYSDSLQCKCVEMGRR